MRLAIELNKDNAITPVVSDPPVLQHIAGELDWIPALKYAADKFAQFNILAELALENGPIKVNQMATQVEGFLGAVNTPPTEFGQVTIDIPNLDQFRHAPELIMSLQEPLAGLFLLSRNQAPDNN